MELLFVMQFAFGIVFPRDPSLDYFKANSPCYAPVQDDKSERLTNYIQPDIVVLYIMLQVGNCVIDPTIKIL